MQETLSALGMTQAELGRRIGQSQKDMNKIIRGRTLISVKMAHKLEEVLKISASFWIKLEKNYQKSLSRLQREKCPLKHPKQGLSGKGNTMDMGNRKKSRKSVCGL